MNTLILPSPAQLGSFTTVDLGRLLAPYNPIHPAIIRRHKRAQLRAAKRAKGVYWWWSRSLYYLIERTCVVLLILCLVVMMCGAIGGLLSSSYTVPPEFRWPIFGGLGGCVLSALALLTLTGYCENLLVPLWERVSLQVFFREGGTCPQEVTDLIEELESRLPGDAVLFVDRLAYFEDPVLGVQGGGKTHYMRVW